MSAHLAEGPARFLGKRIHRVIQVEGEMGRTPCGLFERMDIWRPADDNVPLCGFCWRRHTPTKGGNAMHREGDGAGYARP